MSAEGAAPLSTEAQIGQNKHWHKTDPSKLPAGYCGFCYMIGK